MVMRSHTKPVVAWLPHMARWYCDSHSLGISNKQIIGSRPQHNNGKHVLHEYSSAMWPWIPLCKSQVANFATKKLDNEKGHGILYKKWAASWSSFRMNSIIWWINYENRVAISNSEFTMSKNLYLSKGFPLDL